MPGTTTQRDGSSSAHPKWSIEGVRDYFQTVIHANEVRYEEDRANIRSLIEATELRYEQKFQMQERALAVALATLADVRREQDLRHEQRYDALLRAAAAESVAIQATREAKESAIYAKIRDTKEHFESVLELRERAVVIASTSLLATMAEHEKINREGDKMVMARCDSQQASTALVIEACVAGSIARKNEWLLTAEALRDRLDTSIAVQTSAVMKAELANEKRFDGVNEFRAALADQQRLLIPRAEVDVIVQSLSEKLEINNEGLRDHGSRIVALATAAKSEASGLHSGWGYAVGVVGLVLSVLALVSLFSHGIVALPIPSPIHP